MPLERWELEHVGVKQIHLCELWSIIHYLNSVLCVFKILCLYIDNLYLVINFACYVIYTNKIELQKALQYLITNNGF